ncbi:GNAT family N-acetyltransferase [Xanthomonas euvesicatoria pv. eucalypti]|uniref:GNAT family N-acetyltransferase n=1 Tax=Xanthomonas euvesicatoria TaxID=456327 RepID=UPI0026E2ED26|nr:GNAT family N-acetyltransferase [Xanthomonas euvesicatoria]MDO7933019.1 GNAT family N-acetyltransferase [Xanthomonas euvesicatoria pv. eucalypti]MDO7936313.1 GNAT family N-acetyltransferase [Xanthomonas euvesicatoria pv. eucalypti]MDO7941646.1 GNAT family N-acetyltransferase [Xanthomonas euvesicatoria pv. eucalypti]MDO7946788.1 GNAT family N-acetyltransferase [Xanthomonas euvesicatoria pv. eucalypti]MDO7948177.1 GNAT family N-acetyltransferase [Xanthomonas euvesicatoria pv. eucalypti]
MSRPAPQIRSATPEDVPLLHELITALAVYEREPDAVKAGLEELRASLFGDGATAHALICEQDGQALGFAVYFFNYSTWLGRNGLYLEDLFVRPEARGKGAGLALLRHLAQLAVQRGCGRFEWSVLDWNQPAIGFYKAVGARPMDGWTVYRLDGERLAAFAAGA